MSNPTGLHSVAFPSDALRLKGAHRADLNGVRAPREALEDELKLHLAHKLARELVRNVGTVDTPTPFNPYTTAYVDVYVLTPVQLQKFAQDVYDAAIHNAQRGLYAPYPNN